MAESTHQGVATINTLSQCWRRPVGSDWLAEIELRLERVQVVITIVTPVSIELPWLWFEIGATWGNGRQQKLKIYQECVKWVNEGQERR